MTVGELLAYSADWGKAEGEMAQGKDSAARGVPDAAVDGVPAGAADVMSKPWTPVTDPSAPGEILIFDDGEVGVDVGRRLGNMGYHLTFARPGEDLAVLIGAKKITSAAVNLALPNGWGTMRRLRNLNGVPLARLYAYALASTSDTGIWLGVVDFFFLGIDDPTLVNIVRRLAPPATRVLAISNDPSQLGEVRDQLTAARITVGAIVGPAQVEQAVTDVRPQVAALHLSSQCFGIFQAYRTLRAQAGLRDIPVLFLLEPMAHPSDVAAFSAGLRQLADGKTTVAELASQLCFQLKLNAHRGK